MKVYLSDFILENSRRFTGSCRITVDTVTYAERVKFHAEITGYSVVYCVSNGSMREPRIFWGDFNPHRVFRYPNAALGAVNKALRIAVPRITPVGRQTDYHRQGVTPEVLSQIGRMLMQERVEVFI